MKIVDTRIDEVKIIEPTVFTDGRGFFMESHNKRSLSSIGLEFDALQENYISNAEAGVLRGLHFQNVPHAQTKIVKVVSGAVFDVAVDIRRGSPTYLQYAAAILSAENFRQFVVPKGFAHGVIALVPDTKIIYKVDAYYSAENDRAVRWDDPEIGIEWPWSNPVLSEKDRSAPYLGSADHNFVYGENL